MTYIRNLIIVLILVSFTSQISAETRKLPRENINIHLSQKLLFTGETLWFSLHYKNTLSSKDTISTITYVELLNQKNQALIRKKILLDGKSNSYFLNLPDTISSGIYTLLSYTRWMKNFTQNSFGKKELIVINPLKKNGINKINTEKGSSNNNSKALAGSNLLSFKTNAKIPLQSILKLNDIINGVYSVSIKRKEPDLLKENSQVKSVQVNPDSIEFLADYNGIVINGIVQDVNNTGRKHSKVLLSYPGNGTELEETYTDKNGYFNFVIPAKKGSIDLVFSMENKEDKVILLSSFSEVRSSENKKLPKLNSSQYNYIGEKYICNQLENRFGNNKNYKTSADTCLKSIDCFYSKPDRTYKMSDYVKFDSLYQCFYEIIPHVKFIRSKNEYKLRVLIENASMYPKNEPGVFVDGVLYTDYNKLAKIPCNEIDRIDVFNHVYYYKNFTFNGIVSIFTEKADLFNIPLQDNMYRVIQPLAAEENKIFLNTDTKKKSEYHPDLRYLLYWNPRLNKQQMSDCFFYSCDIEGIYEVEVKGFNHKGNWKVYKQEFKISN